MVRERERGKTKEATAAPSCKKEAFDKWVIETQNKTKQNQTEEEINNNIHYHSFIHQIKIIFWF
jgi:hypothetical protein